MVQETYNKDKGEWRLDISLDAVPEFLETREITGGGKLEGCSVTNKDGKWSGTRTYEQALELLLNGDAVTVSKMKKLEFNIKPAEINSYNYRLVDDPADLFDIGQVVAGIPECYLQNEPAAQRRCVSILFNNTVSARITAEQYMEAGKKAYEFISSLELNGIDVELSVLSATWQKSPTSEARCTGAVFNRIKEFGKIIDPERLWYCLVNPSYLRRIIFALMERTPVEYRKQMQYHAGGNYGVPFNRREVLALLESEGRRYDIVADYLTFEQDVADFLKKSQI